MSKARKQTKQAAALAAVIRCAIYIRVSSERQAEKVSPEAQEQDCRALAERQGYIVVKVYRDTEKYRVGKRLVEPTGTRADRPGLRAMLADARRGDFDVILAWREDRLYRSYRPMLDVLDVLEEMPGLDIELAKETFDKTIAPVKAWAAKMELQAKHDRTMMGMAARFKQGKARASIVPYGYAVSDERYVVDEAEAQWVVQIWQWYGDGISAGEIRRRLVASGAKQRNSEKNKTPWPLNYIRHIITAKSYRTGALPIKWDGEIYDLPVPVIIDSATADRVQRRRERYKQNPAGNLKAHTLAAGVVYCAACGHKMRVTTSSVYNKRIVYLYYVCENYQCRQNHVEGCAKRVAIGRLDAEIWRKVWEVLTDPALFEARVRAALAEKRAQEVDAEAECEKQQQRLDDLAMMRQEAIAWAQAKIISKADMELRLASLSIEQIEAERELRDNSLLLGNRAERFIAAAQVYRERLVAGRQVVQDPQTPEEEKALFEWKRQVVQGTVKRVDVLADKTPNVNMEFDDKMLELEGEQLPQDLCIKYSHA